MTRKTDAAERESLILQARGAEEIQRLVAIVSLGLCRALASGAISPGYACTRLLGPALLKRMELLSVAPPLRDAVHLATELEDVAHLVPHALDESIQEIERALLTLLQSIAVEPTDGVRWLAPRSSFIVEPDPEQ